MSLPEQKQDFTRPVVEALRRIIRAVDVHSRRLVQTCGLTGPQLLVLKAIEERTGERIGDLARDVHLSQATVTGILDRLEHRGLVQRVRSTVDRRRVKVILTEPGVELLRCAPPLLQDHFVERFRTLDEADQEQVLEALQQIVALMEAHVLSATPILTTGPIDASPERTRAFLELQQPEDEP